MTKVGKYKLSGKKPAGKLSLCPPQGFIHQGSEAHCVEMNVRFLLHKRHLRGSDGSIVPKFNHPQGFGDSNKQMMLNT